MKSYISHKLIIASSSSSSSFFFSTRRDGFGVAVLKGNMSATQRKSELDRFISDPRCTVFILSIRSGGVGLTLTAAQHVFLFEPQQNPALTLQAIERVHRVGQTKDVHIHHLIIENSVEERIMEYTKSKLATSAEGGGEDFTGRRSNRRHNDTEAYGMRVNELTRLFD